MARIEWFLLKRNMPNALRNSAIVGGTGKLLHRENGRKHQEASCQAKAPKYPPYDSVQPGVPIEHAPFHQSSFVSRDGMCYLNALKDTVRPSFQGLEPLHL
jgi:hypothetical protein